MPDFAAAYTETRDRLIELVRPLDKPGLAAFVPATPAWTINDVVAHLTHVAGAYAAGHHSYSTQDMNELAVVLSDDLPDVDRWAQEGVDERRCFSFEEIINEWFDQTGALCQMMAGRRPLPRGTSRDTLAWAAVSDLATHAQDIRGALCAQPDREAYATKLAYASFTMMLEVRAASADVPSIRMVTQRGEVVIGAQAATRTVEVDWYELLRATAGRRNVHQIRRLFAPNDASPYLAVISPYPLPVGPLLV
jgi:uncharacterized protein (TIGR03083 family)